MCAGATKWPNTCKFQHLKFVAASVAEAENEGCFVIGIDVYNSTKQININGTPTAHCTSMHRQ